MDSRKDSKNTFRRVVVITAIVTAGCLGIAAIIGVTTAGFLPARAGAEGTTVDERKSLPATGVDSVSIDTVSVDARVAEGDGESVEIWLHGSAGAAPKGNLPRLEAERSGSTVVIRIYPERTFGFGFYWSRMALDVSLPKGYAQKLSVKTVSGDVHVSDSRSSALSISTTSGDVDLGRLTGGKLSMKTTSGALTAASVEAELSDVTSVSGDIRIRSLHGPATLHSTSGDVTAVLPAVPSRLDATSTSGKIALTFPQDAKFMLDAHSTSGDITCQFPITISQSSSGGGRHALAGAVGGGAGAGQVIVRTVSGDIRLTP